MSATRVLLSALLLSAAFLPARAQMPTSREIAEACADPARATPATTRPATGVYILERFETLDDTTGHAVPSPIAADEALDPEALAQATLSTLAHTIARDIEAELEAAARLSWIEVDAEARTAVVVGTATTGRRPATFTEDFSCLLPDDGDTAAMRVSAVDVDGFALQIRAFTIHRLTWRQVDEDDADLAAIRRARDAGPAPARGDDALTPQ